MPMNAIDTIVKGIAAGFVATSVLSALMLIKYGLPQLETITVMDGVARDLAMAAGLPTPLAGWFWHFVIGCIVWGWMYAVMEPILPGGRPLLKGLYFGFTTTLLVWLIVLPLAGAGLFGTHLSVAQPFVALIQHLVYGMVLAMVYAKLAASRVI